MYAQVNDNQYKSGLIYGIIGNILWGVLPIYCNALKPIESSVIILYRITLMALVCFFIVRATCGRNNPFAPMFESRKAFLTYFMSGIVITINWSIYIWAVNAGHVIQTSMGYFMEPLVVCLFGIIIYKEKPNIWKKIAICFAAAGLLIMIIGYREIPLIAVSLGLSFAVYSAIKKSVNLPPFQSLLYETVFLAPVALGAIVFLEINGKGALQVGGYQFILLLFAAICTASPLALFSSAANKISLITLGICEYISPTLSLIIGIFLLKEQFDTVQLCAFCVIWIGLVFFTYGERREVWETVKQ